MNKKEKQAAVRSALTDRVQQNKVIVLDQLSMSEYKTKEFVKVMENLKAAGKTLVVMADKDEHLPRTQSPNWRRCTHNGNTGIL